jgi:hypothetical protein
MGRSRILKVAGTNGALSANVSFTTNVTLQGKSQRIPNLVANVALPNFVTDAKYPLTWSISFDGGTTYSQIGTTNTEFFVTYDKPALVLNTDGHVTAKRLQYVTHAEDGINDVNRLAKDTALRVAEHPGFNVAYNPNNPEVGKSGQHWYFIDPPETKADCISLSFLAIKELRMLGVSSATVDLAYPSLDVNGGKPPVVNSDASTQQTSTINGTVATLGFWASDAVNKFEGYFEYKDGGVRKAFTIAPALGPILESTNQKVVGDKLKYQVMRVTLLKVGAKQYWMQNGAIANNTHVPFPIP